MTVGELLKKIDDYGKWLQREAIREGRDLSRETFLETPIDIRFTHETAIKNPPHQVYGRLRGVRLETPDDDTTLIVMIGEGYE